MGKLTGKVIGTASGSTSTGQKSGDSRLMETFKSYEEKGIAKGFITVSEAVQICGGSDSSARGKLRLSGRQILRTSKRDKVFCRSGIELNGETTSLYFICDLEGLQETIQSMKKDFDGFKVNELSAVCHKQKKVYGIGGNSSKVKNMRKCNPGDFKEVPLNFVSDLLTNIKELVK